MLSIIKGSNRRYFCEMLIEQNISKKLIIEYLKLNKDYKNDKLIHLNPNYNQLFDIASRHAISIYKKEIAEFWNQSQMQFPENIESIENDIGHTSKFNYLKDQFQFQINYSNDKNVIFNSIIDERELICLINKIKSGKISNENLNQFIKRQLLKKVFYYDLYMLLNLDIIYESELESINKILSEDNFGYRLLKQESNEHEEDASLLLNDINLLNCETKCITKIQNISKVDKLRIHLLLLKRDCDLIKLNLNDSYHQALIIEDFEYLCDNNIKIINELLTRLIYLINKMNMQVILTMSSFDGLITNKSSIENICMLEIWKDENANQHILKEFKGENREIENELNYIEQKRTKYDFNEKKLLKEEKDKLENKVNQLEEKNNNISSQIEGLKKELRATKNELDSVQKLQKLVVNTPELKTQKIIQPVNQTSNIQADSINAFINKENLSEEDAKCFIELLEKERKSWNGEALDIICGSIKNLTANLYTLSIHYVYELLQNIEDAKYKTEKCHEAHVKIIMNKNFILFCNNEIGGFTAKDVKSISSLSVSEKQLNTHIGHKGIGFKSVSLCTNNPIIVSSVWKFQFKFDEENVLSYLIPYNVEQLPYELADIIETNQDMTTFFYLPFKENYPDEYFEDTFNSIDINILLFTKNIQTLIINNNILEKETVFKKKETILFEKFYDYEDNEELMEIVETILFKDNNIYQKYRVFRCKSKTNNIRANEITFAFPIGENNKNKTYPIYSIFPIYKLNLKFLISAYFQLVTNRETINEHNFQNINLRDKIIFLISYIFQNDEIITSDLLRYLPNIMNLDANDWWIYFFSKLADQLKPFLNEQFAHKRIMDKNIEEFASKKVFSLIGIDIIQIEEASNYNNNLDNYGIRKANVHDLLKLLESDITEVQKWRERLDWDKLFDFLNLNSEILRSNNLIYKSKIFLIESNRQFIDQANKEIYFIFSNYKNHLKAYCSGHSIKIIDFESRNEETFLTFLGFSHIDEQKLMKIVLRDHCYNDLKSETLLQDFEFIKCNFEIYEKEIKIQPDLSILVPATTCENKKTVSTIEHASIPTLFSVDLSRLPLKNENFMFVDCNKGSFKETLENEIFLLKLKCKLPEVNIILLKEKILLSDKYLPLLVHSEFLNDVNDFNKSLANELFNLLPKEYILVVQLLPIETKFNKIVSISSVFFSDNVNDEQNELLIDVPTRSRELARKFGIKEKVKEFKNDTFELTESVIISDDFDDEQVDTSSFNKKNFQNYRNRNYEFKVFSIDNKISQKEMLDELTEIYSTRVKTQGADERRYWPYKPKVEKSSQLVNFEDRTNTGIKGEYFFYLHLQNLYGNSLNAQDCWVSSFKSILFDDLTNFDDSKGYDFVINDTRNCYSSGKCCFFEVKSFANNWNRTFHITRNELAKKDSVTLNEAYFIVIIEEVADSNQIRIAEVINWAENDAHLRIQSVDSYEYIYTR